MRSPKIILLILITLLLLTPSEMSRVERNPASLSRDPSAVLRPSVALKSKSSAVPLSIQNLTLVRSLRPKHSLSQSAMLALSFQS
ncbi:hypothetical protein PF008_g28369 [Phytophthora fragariae]|uniref:RxLR effector protein n=1 Tax=Phytophthora fragariae TaxID=53985 RepID=A0A6G0QBN1_9STRA|nr:hypothetical protein PF008_g28369 [Phytophthora fragariae]